MASGASDGLASAGNGEIRGIVRDQVSGAGLPSVHLQLSLDPDKIVIAETSSDESGKFVFSNVLKGKYTVAAEKGGYVSLVARSESRHVSITDADPTSVVLRLTPCASITGNVFDRSGQPMRWAKVAAVAQRFLNGTTKLAVVAGPVETDDRGIYRIYGLTAGRYSVVLLPDGAFLGSSSFAPVYFRDSIESDAAQFFDLKPGESRTGMDLTIQRTTGGKIRGRVVDVPAEWQLGQTAVALSTTTGVRAQIQTIEAGGSGDFVFEDVPSGIYQVAAWGPIMGLGEQGPFSGQHPKRGGLRIQVASGDLNGVEIQLHDVVAIDGMIAFESGSNAAADCFANAQIALHPVDPFPDVASLTAGPPTRGQFVIRDVPKGSYALVMNGLNDGCFLWGARMGRSNLIKGVIAVEDTGPLTVFVSTRTGVVEGTVVNADDKPVAAVTVFLVPSDNLGKPTEIGDVLTTTSGPVGEFTLHGVRPGHYRVIGVTEVLSTDYLSPYFQGDYGTIDVDLKPLGRVTTLLRPRK